MAINPRIKQKAEDIRKKIFGSEVRESLASGLEGMSEDVESIKGRQDTVEDTFQAVIEETTDKDVISAPEIIAARGGHDNLSQRLLSTDQQLQQTEQDLTAQLAENKTNLNVVGYGALADGVASDVAAVVSAYAQSGYLFFPKKNANVYLINTDITLTKDTAFVGQNVTLKSTNGSSIFIGDGVKTLGLSGITFDGLAVRTNTRTANDLTIIANRIYMKNTPAYGLSLAKLDKLIVTESTFDEIGTGAIDITYQGIAIRVDGANRVLIKNSNFRKTHGIGAIVLRDAVYLEVSSNNSISTDYRFISLVNDTLIASVGTIDKNVIERCGVDATHTTGVGCNGIYGNKGNFDGVTVRGNKIKNVCENGIEGVFGIVEDNEVDGTGIDQVNHPTPSACGINLYGKVYRRNRVKNSYLNAYYRFDNIDVDGTGIKNLIVEDNYSENSGGDYSVFINAASYENVSVRGNKTDKPMYYNRSATHKNVKFSGNDCFPLDFYTTVYNTKGVMILDKAIKLKRGFAFSSDIALSDFVVSNVTIAKQSATENGFAYYYPQITNANNTFGKITLTLPDLPKCYLILKIMYSGNSLDLSYVPKNSDGTAGTTLYLNLATGTDVVEYVVYNVENATQADIIFKIKNSEALAVGMIKKLEIFYISK